MDEMRLSESNPTVDIEWIVGFPRSFGDRERRGVCELVAGAYDESPESALGVERILQRLDIDEGRRAGRQAVGFGRL
jgi:hypothetical protein